MTKAEGEDGWIGHLIAEHRAGWSLAQPFYTSPEIFRRDLERIFMRRWLYTGHISRIRRPGDYFIYEIGEESLIVIRGREGEVHGLFNVCRHRGSRICLEPSGTTKALVCPYHGWTYSSDGRLAAARGLPADARVDELGLRRCRVHVLEGLIYINLGGEAPEFESYCRDCGPFLQPFDLPRTKIAATTRWEVKANWKLVIENFAECYHCGPAHPEYCSVMAHAVPASYGEKSKLEAFQALVDGWEERTRARGQMVGKVDGPTYACGRIPIQEGFLTQSRDGRPVAPLLGGQKEYDGGYTSARIYPGSYFFISNDHAVIPRFTPLAPTRTEVEFSWLVREDAVEGRDYNQDDLTWVWTVTTEQDKTIVEHNQAGVKSAAYRPGPYTSFESNLPRFNDWYLRQIASTE